MGAFRRFTDRPEGHSTLLPSATYLRVDSVTYFPRCCLATLRMIPQLGCRFQGGAPAPGEGAAVGCSPALRFDIISPVGRGEILSGSWRLDAPRIDSAVSENTATIDRMDSMMDRHCLLGRALSSCIHTGLLQGFPKCMVGSTPLFHASGSPAVSRACAEGERG